MFERPDIGQRAILVHVIFNGSANNQELGEFKDLVRSTGAEIATVITVQRSVPDAKLLIGSGKVEEIGSLANSLEADIVIFNYSLSSRYEYILIFVSVGIYSILSILNQVTNKQ